MTEPDNANWGFFRRPALLGPIVGFLAFLVAEAIRSPVEGGRSDDWIIWFALILIIAYLFSAIPYLLGAFVLLAVCRVLPAALVQLTVFRMLLGGLVGGSIAWPFAHALNWIPSATTTEPRFNFGSVLIACAVAGGYCAAFFSASTPVKAARSGTGG